MLEVVSALFVFVVGAMVLLLVRGGSRLRVVPPLTVDRARPPLGRLFPWMLAALVAAVLIFGVGLMPWISLAISVLIGVSAAILTGFLATRRIARLEFQLADSLDLMVSTLRAGGSLLESLTSAGREAGPALRPLLHELVERIQFGEQPREALADLEARIPLESFRLFTFTLATHWEGGGSLATTLSNVGRTIRDRVTVVRRVRAQAVETQVSVIGVLVITYGLALLMWHNYPDRFGAFAGSELGSRFIAASILMQGVGLFWITRLTKIEV